MPQPIYDCIVVGSGAAGGIAAQRFCTAGLRVLMLEAGRNVDFLETESYHHKMPSEFPHRGFLSPAQRKRYSYAVNSYQINAYNKHILADERQNPYTTPPGKPFLWVRARCVGGKTLYWGRMSFRWSDLDFQASTDDGYGVDWPIRYSDLKPYYDYMEELIEVSGTREGIWHLPDGVCLPAVPLRCGEIGLAV